MLSDAQYQGDANAAALNEKNANVKWSSRNHCLSHPYAGCSHKSTRTQAGSCHMRCAFFLSQPCKRQAESLRMQCVFVCPNQTPASGQAIVPLVKTPTARARTHAGHRAHTPTDLRVPRLLLCACERASVRASERVSERACVLSCVRAIVRACYRGYVLPCVL